MKKVLLLGGTGAMGKALVDLLDKTQMEVYVTSRKAHTSDTLHYIQGNAHDIEFLDSLLEMEAWDSIVDFMNWKLEEFQVIAQKILPKTKQYVFISSARVYAQVDGLITEDSPRLLDVCDDADYVASNEYAIAKAKEENLLIQSDYRNWTIVRPSLTYNDNRMQFALWEKEEWLYRALQGRSIIFPKNMMNVKTTMSHGRDVSAAIAKLVCNEAAYGETVHIAGAKSMTWAEILDVYVQAIKDNTGKEVKVHYIEDWQAISKKCCRFYQAKYARIVDRQFSSEKIMQLTNNEVYFVSPEEGLTECIKSFLDSDANFNTISWRIEAICDSIAGEKTKLKEFHSAKRKCAYLVMRYLPFLL